MFSKRFHRLAVQRGFGELSELVESVGIGVEERGSGRGVREQSCEAGRRAGLKVPPRLDGRELSKCAAHCERAQWRSGEGVVVLASELDVEVRKLDICLGALNDGCRMRSEEMVNVNCNDDNQLQRTRMLAKPYKALIISRLIFEV